MLIRLINRRQPSFITRLLSDKVGDSDAKHVLTGTHKQDPKPKNPTKVSASTEKIQDLLRSMIEADKIKEKSRVQISTAPGIFKRNTKNNITEVKEEKIDFAAHSRHCYTHLERFTMKNYRAGCTELDGKHELFYLAASTDLCSVLWYQPGRVIPYHLEKVTTAVSEVAAALGGDTKRTEAELLSRVLGDVTQSPTNLSDLVLGMQVDRSKEPDEGFKLESRGEQVRRLVRQATPGARPPHRDRFPLKGRETIHATKATYIDIFSETPLGILKPIDNPNNGPQMEMWEKLKQRELTLATMQPPSNYFEKMILWTEQGKVWKFPINNEQGLEEEAKVHFTEHVFVDNHLEGWCPPRGPIRHFMELVCVGLSKNPFYTAQEKKDHIMWFKDYFESKKDILAQVEGLEYASTTKQEQNV